MAEIEGLAVVAEEVEVGDTNRQRPIYADPSLEGRVTFSRELPWLFLWKVLRKCSRRL